MRHAVESEELLTGTRSVHIVLSHFHLDHVVGLGYLPAFRLPSPPVLWGPGQALYGNSTGRILRQLLEPPFFTPGIASLFASIGELAEGENQCGAFSVRARQQPRHSEPTFAFRIDDLIAYCTDTAYDEGNAAFARNCSVLFHEAWSAESGPNADIHTSAREAGAIARRAGVDRLVLIHLNPLPGYDELDAATRREFDGTIVGRDLLEVAIG